MTANVKQTVEQRRLLRNLRCLSAGSDSLYCRSNEQSDLKVTHENTPNAPPCFKSVIFWHHYVTQKNSRYIETEQRYLCRVLYFNTQN